MPTTSDLPLSTEQEYAARAPIDRPLLIQSPPGSGKTHTLTARITHVASSLKAQGISGSVLALTFSSAAAKEMRDRVLSKACTSVETRTFHSFCLSVVNVHFNRLGYASKPSLCPSRSSNELLMESAREHYTDFDSSRFKALRKCISFGKSLLDPEKHFEEMNKEILPVYMSFQARLRASNAIEFSDMLQLTKSLLEREPDVLDYIRSRHPAVVVDEFQDTSALQFEIVRLLCNEHRRVTVVGDIDQLIYSFQGADHHNFKKFLTSFSIPSYSSSSSVIEHQLEHITLRTNYRSKGPIIFASNLLLSRNDKMGMVPSKENERGPPVALVECNSNESIYAFVLSEISFLVANKGVRPDDIAVLYRHNETGEEFKNFIKSNKQKHSCKFKSSDNLESQWNSARFVRFLGTMSLLVNTTDDMACANALPYIGKTASIVLKTTIDELKAKAVLTRQIKLKACDEPWSPSIFALIKESSCKALQSWANKIEDLASRVREEEGLTMKRVVEIVLEVSKTRRMFTSSSSKAQSTADDCEDEEEDDDSFGDEQSHADILADVLVEAESWDRRQRATGVKISSVKFSDLFSAFVDFISSAALEGSKVGQLDASISSGRSFGKDLNHQTHSRAPPSEPVDSGGARSWVGTIHKSKGLQWQVVFVLKCDSERFPYKGRDREIDASSDDLESQRLLYVAMTRAKERLYLTHQAVSASRPNYALSPLLLPFRAVAKKTQLEQERIHGQLVVVGFPYPMPQASRIVQSIAQNLSDMNSSALKHSSDDKQSRFDSADHKRLRLVEPENLKQESVPVNSELIITYPVEPKTRGSTSCTTPSICSQSHTRNNNFGNIHAQFKRPHQLMQNSINNFGSYHK